MKIANFDEDHAGALGGSTAVIAEQQADAAIADHVADTTEAHQATGVAILDATGVRYGPLPWLTSGSNTPGAGGYYAADNVEGALAEIGGALAVLGGTGVRYGPLPWLTSAASGTPAMTNPMTTQDDIIVGGASGAPGRLGKGTDGQVLTVDPTTHHLLWATPAAASGDVATDTIWDAKGDLAGGTGANTAARLAVGTNGHVLTADSAETTGMKWAAAGGGSSDAILGQSGGGGARISGLQASPDIDVAGANDDEFTSSALTGWTQFGSPTICNADTKAKSHLYIKKAATARQICGIYKANPSMPFTMTAKLSDGTCRKDYQRAGLIFVAEAGLTGKIAALEVVHDSSNFPNIPVYVPGASLFTNSSTYGSNIAVAFHDLSGASRAMPLVPPCYLRIVATSSTNVAYYVSAGGFVWQPLVTGNNPGFTIGAVGLGTDPEQTTYDSETLFDWIRFT